jgi:hypothetical protein
MLPPLPWVSAGDGNAVTVKVIHEADQYLEGVPAREFALTHSARPPYGDFWSATVPIAGTAPSVLGAAWGMRFGAAPRIWLVAERERRKLAHPDSRANGSMTQSSVPTSMGMPLLMSKAMR